MRTKALLVDDHPMLRDGLALLLAHMFPNWHFVQAGSLAQAVECLDEAADFGLVILDLTLPDSEGLMTLVRLRQKAPGPRYVVLTASSGEALVLGAIEHGAAGFIPKTAQTAALVSAMRTVLGGGVFLPEPLAAPQGEPVPARSASEVLGISPRQSEVLRLLIEGKSNKAIGRDLRISESTVKTHLETIYRKLDATSRTQAVVAAARLGLRLDSEPD